MEEVVTYQITIKDNVIVKTKLTDLDFGVVSPESFSKRIVFQAEFLNFAAVGNLKLYLPSSSADKEQILFYTTKDMVQAFENDFSTFNRYSSNQEFFDVGFLSSNQSDYVALCINANNKISQKACALFKWIFNYNSF